MYFNSQIIHFSIHYNDSTHNIKAKFASQYFNSAIFKVRFLKYAFLFLHFGFNAVFLSAILLVCDSQISVNNSVYEFKIVIFQLEI